MDRTNKVLDRDVDAPWSNPPGVQVTVQSSSTDPEKNLEISPMKIWICEQWHDNDCGVFTKRDAALGHLDKCRSCEVVEYHRIGDEFVRIESVRPVKWCRCDNCGSEWRSDIQQATTSGYDYCSDECFAETREFYDDGGRGIHGYTTRQVKQMCGEAILLGKDPYEGCASTSSGVRPSLGVLR